MVQILIQKVTRHTRKTDKYLRSTDGQVPLQAVIAIKGNHNHHLQCGETLRKNRTSEATKRKLTELFDDGRSPAQAKRIITDSLLAEGNLLDLADNKVNPTSNSLYHIHNVWSENKFGKDAFNCLEKLRENIASGHYEKNGKKLHLTDPNYLYFHLKK